MKKSIIIILIIISSIITLALVIGIPILIRNFVRDDKIITNELDAHLRIIHKVDSSLGFTYGTPYIKGREVFIIESVDRGLPMDKAGLRVGDYPDYESIADFYAVFVFHQGEVVSIPVIRNEVKKVIHVEVPKLNLVDDPSKLHWYFKKHVDAK